MSNPNHDPSNGQFTSGPGGGGEGSADATAKATESSSVAEAANNSVADANNQQKKEFPKNPENLSTLQKEQEKLKSLIPAQVADKITDFHLANISDGDTSILSVIATFKSDSKYGKAPGEGTKTEDNDYNIGTWQHAAVVVGYGRGRDRKDREKFGLWVIDQSDGRTDPSGGRLDYRFISIDELKQRNYHQVRRN